MYLVGERQDQEEIGLCGLGEKATNVSVHIEVQGELTSWLRDHALVFGALEVAISPCRMGGFLSRLL